MAWSNLIGYLVGAAAGYLFVCSSGANGFGVAFYYPVVRPLLSALSGLLIGLLLARANIVETVQYE